MKNFNDFLKKTEKINREFMERVTILIPKVKNAKKTEDFRPIPLLTRSYCAK